MLRDTFGRPKAPWSRSTSPQVRTSKLVTSSRPHCMLPGLLALAHITCTQRGDHAPPERTITCLILRFHVIQT